MKNGVSVGYRDKMRDECVALLGLLLKRRTITLVEICEEIGIHERTTRRWVKSFGLCWPVKLRGGVVRMLDNRFLEPDEADGPNFSTP